MTPEIEILTSATRDSIIISVFPGSAPGKLRFTVETPMVLATVAGLDTRLFAEGVANAFTAAVRK